MGMDFSGHEVTDEEDPYHMHKRGGAPVPSAKYVASWGDMHEAMGSPTVIGPFVPYDGPSMRNGRDSRPPLDVDGRPVAPRNDGTDYDPKIGPNNMWGGDATIPGGDRGFAASPMMGEEDPEVTKWKPPEEEKMNLREFFDPETPPTEEVENPEQTHEKDQTDDEIENRLDRNYGQEDNHEFDDGKEPDDDSTEYSSSSDDGMAVFGDVGSPDEEAAEAEDRAAPGTFPPPQPEDGRAGLIMLDDDPAGFIDLVGGQESGSDEMSDDAAIGMGDPGDDPGVKAEVDAQDFQLTVEPEAGQMPTLSQMMDPQDRLVGKGGPDNIVGMQQAARGLLPQKSSWDEIAIQVGDAIVNLRKTGGIAPQQPPAPSLQPVPEDSPPMMEGGKRRRRR
jgi:hypothetical protein